MNLSDKQISNIAEQLECSLTCYYHITTGEIESLQAPMSSNKDKNGRTTLVWAQETLWYPGNDYQNYFAYFMHTAKTADGT